MREEFPALPLYVTDFFGSPRVAEMDLITQGIYLVMLMRCWQMNGAGLPAGIDAAVASLGGRRTTAARSKTIRSEVAALSQRMFIEIDERLFNQRLEDELTKAMELRKAKSDAGKTGNLKRWGNDRTAIAPSPSPSPSPSSPPTPARRGNGALRSEGRSPRFLGTNPRAVDCGDPERSALIHRAKLLASKRRLRGYEVVSTGLVHLVSGNEERWGSISTDRLRKLLDEKV